MKAKDHAVFEEGDRNYHQPLNAGGQTIPQEFSIDGCPQNGESSSKEKDTRQTKETSSRRLHYSNLDDILAQTKLNPKIVTIPDDQLKKVVDDFLKGGHLDSPGEMGRNGSDILREIETKRNKEVKVEI